MTHDLVLQKIRHPLLRKIGLHRLDERIENIQEYEIDTLPDNTTGLGHAFCLQFKNQPFSLTYDFEKNKTLFLTANIKSENVQALQDAWPGLTFKPKENEELELTSAFRLDGFPFQQAYSVKDPQGITQPEHSQKPTARFETLFSALNGKNCHLTIGFQPVSTSELEKERAQFEKILSIDSSSRQGATHDAIMAKNHSHATTTAIVEKTDQTRIAAEIVTMINDAKTQNDAINRVSIYGTGPDAPLLKKMLETRYMTHEEKLRDVQKARFKLPLPHGEIMSGQYAAEFIHFDPAHAKTQTAIPLETITKDALNTGILLGKELKNAIKPTERTIHLHPDALMLHGLITGLNGMGKTTLAHQIASDCLKNNVPVITFSPDKEWTRLARSSPNLYIIPLYDSVPFNLVRCPDNTPVQQYYQNLALWLGKAMNAGPYTQPLIKTMLAAFTELYRKKPEPTLEEVYDAIEEATESAFGIRLASGEFKMDKYGHNIKSSLENLRQILLKQNYQAKKGVKIEDCIKNGAVFDASEVSELLKPLFYAFLYSQIFSYVLKNYDEKARHLRLLLCMEEAHLVFKNDEEHEAKHLTQDLENKLGLLRKRGIGLLFITHFSDQLNESIQRYTQNKISFRQDSHSIDQTIKDLAFPLDDFQLLNKAKTKFLQLKPFEACCRLSDQDNLSHGPAFIQIQPQFVDALTPEELKVRTDALKQNLPPEPEAEAAPEKEENVWEHTTDFNDPYTVIQTLKAIGAQTAQTPQELIKIRGIGKRYKNALIQLFDKGLVTKNRRETRTKNATVYQLTSLGQQAYYYYHNDFPKMPEISVPGENHTASLKAITEHFADFKTIHILASYVQPGPGHGELGINTFQAKSRLDMILEKKTEKERDVLLIEYEVGTNNDTQLLTNLTKLAHNQAGLQKAMNITISGTPIPANVKSYWIAKNEDGKNRLLKLLIKYRAATHEHLTMTICTLHELLEGKDKPVIA